MNIAELIETLLVCGCVIVGIVALLQIDHAFRRRELDPQDASLTDQMRATKPRATSETTMWRLWQGGQASHGFGLLFFAVIYGYLAANELWFLLASPFLIGLSLVTLSGYLVLIRRYWFSAPFMGVALALGAFLAGYIVGYL